MLILPSGTRQINNHKTPSSNKNIRVSNNYSSDARSTIARGQSADLQLIFDFYDIEIDEYNKKCSCPLPHHNDKTPSFNYVKQDNYFNCFGCHSGGGPVEFVALMEGIEKIDAAIKIINQFYTDETALPRNGKDFYETQRLLMKFSDMIYNFRKNNIDDITALSYVDKIALVFDKTTLKLELSNSGLESLINKLQEKLGQYKCQQH